MKRPESLKAPAMTLRPGTVKPGTVQRKCSCGGSCDSCREHKKLVQRQEAAAAPAAAAVTAPGAIPAPVAQQIQSAAASGGAPLPAAARRSLEPRFGNRDFSGVRVHHDARANRLASQLGAEAFTVGNSIFFAAGRFDPQSAAGQRLLAHELTHTVQQGGGPPALQTSLELGASDTAAEREADAVADRVTQGLDAGPVGSLAGGVVSRLPSPFPAVSPTQMGGFEEYQLPSSVPFQLPAGKANDSTDLTWLTNLYKRRPLITNHAGRRLGIWSAWVTSRGDRLNAAGQTAEQVKTAMQSACSPDHVTELQLGGEDHPGNLRILSRGRNEQAGRDINNFIQSVNAALGVSHNNQQVRLRFSEVAPSGGAAPDACLSADPLPHPDAGISTSASRRGGADEFLETSAFMAGGTRKDVGYKRNGETAAPFTINRQHRFAIAGLELENAAEANGGVQFVAKVSAQLRRSPLTAASKNKAITVVGATKGSAAPGQASFQPSPSTLDAAIPLLSTSTMALDFEQGKLHARGRLISERPILREAEMFLEIRDQALAANISIPDAAVRRALPIPGLTISNTNIAIHCGNNQFSATGGFNFAFGNIANGSVTASIADPAGFVATGQIQFRIPGLDTATGDVRVDRTGFQGRITIGRDRFSFPGIQSANVVVTITNGELAGTGTLNLQVPGLNTARLTFLANSRGEYGISGTVSGSIPGLTNPTLMVSYGTLRPAGAAMPPAAPGRPGVAPAGGPGRGRPAPAAAPSGPDLVGIGTAGFVIPGFEGGNVALRYAGGRFSGDASLDYRRGRLSGRITARLSERHRLSGGGELTYQITPGLSAMIGLDIRENGTAAVHGELRLPDPIILFPERTYNRRLFGVSIDIPIFGITFGSRSVGIIANISANLNARAGIGPGQIRQPRITAAFDPSNDAAPATFQASGQLYIPAYADLALAIEGAIGLSLLIVRALGGIRATGSAGLLGALSVPIQLRYQAGKFTVTGAAELFAEPKLRFQLDAFARVQADLFVTTIDLYEKNWRLAAFEWGSAYRIGLRFPVSYTFGEPFNLSLDQLQFIAPEINVRQAIRDLLPR